MRFDAVAECVSLKTINVNMQVLIQFINLHNWMNQTSDDVTVLWQ